MLRLSPGGKKEQTSDFEGWSPEEVKEPNLQKAGFRKQNIHQKNPYPPEDYTSK